MKAPILATILAGLLAASAAGLVVVRVAPFAAPDPETNAAGLHDGHAGDGPHAQLGMERPRFPERAGTIPTADAAKSLEEASFLQIDSDKGFNPSNGVRGGTGTLADPYVISGYHVTGDLYIADTDACFEVRENYLDGQLSLNWNSQCVFVHHNFIRDLRVNENIPRLGQPTGGLIELNKIAFVGQIRHYDGEFRHNEVGPFTPRDIFDGLQKVFEENPFPFEENTRVMNIDGWNQALFHHNRFVGSIDLQIHGHHHGTGFLATHSHYHGDDEARMTHEEDHTDRWQSVVFADNDIVDPKGYGLRYTDENHAGDDRTASSESTEMLEKEHVHHTWAQILRNKVDGAGILVDIFNADDELHTSRNPGWLSILDNAVTMVERKPGLLGNVFFGPLYDQNTGIRVWAAKEARIDVRGNTLSFQSAPATDDPVATLSDMINQAAPFFAADQTAPTAIHLDRLALANVTVAGNKATGFEYGVAARDMAEDAYWIVWSNAMDGAHPVYWDDSVVNQPSEQEPAAVEDPTMADQGDAHGTHEGHVHG
ncbi:MAG: hypothetical protein QOD77_1588 [Thermoplasmata archaeon]|jgi:hypothetical protein|nr:hypothetical protein [Thermoplasmata archaeon]